MHIAQKTTAKDNPIDHAYALMGIGEINVAIGTHGANPDLENARKLFTGLNLRTEAFICQAIQVEHELRNNKNVVTSTLKTTLEKCLRWSWTGDPQLTLYSLQRMGDSALWPSVDFQWAATYAFLYLAFASKKQEKLALYKAIRYLGDLFLADSDENTAESIFVTALDGFTSMDVHRGRAECMIRLGDLAKNRGDLVKAKEFWSTAQPLFKRSLQGQAVAQIDNKLAALEQKRSYHQM
ncbi:hypothetical protein C8F04DRAFT_1198983 [Mycena alexandri]|uniref:Uncharacterized protein n=1 Tax=Mycena alexandri TaxID=1745969 RepID=A0AAD6RZH8_9AGAR|nr:hypothetical protein C8F04DRAFT_1198983 [Mycena alexandri]